MGTEMFSLKGRAALVTGGSRGIGAEICRAFAEAGADVAVVSRKIANCESVAEELRSKGAKAVAIGANIGKSEDCDRAVEETVKAFGRLDILVNNAATSLSFGPSMDCPEDAFSKMFDVNVKGPFMMTRRAMPHMEKAGGGSVVNISSTGGIVPPPMIGIYGATKAGLIHLSKVMAKELGAYGIRVNVVAPGLVRTEFSRALWDNEEILKDFLCRQPIQRLTEPQDITGAVLFLASPASSMVTGEILVVDGGQLLA
jgi:NAD(P)-dependent dehydrogenase (short-subunit alcohol dehydrogenase family)